MSITIEHRVVAIAVNRGLAFDRIAELDPALRHHAWESCLRSRPATLVFVEQGCSNTFIEGKTTRNWNLKFHGERPLDQVILASMGADEGLVSIGEDQLVSAEGYIAHYRAAIRHALRSDEISLHGLDFVLPEHFGVEVAGKEHYRVRVMEHPLSRYLEAHGLLQFKPGTREPVLVRCPGFNALQWHAAMTFLYDVTDASYAGEHAHLTFSIGKSGWLNGLHDLAKGRSALRAVA